VLRVLLLCLFCGSAFAQAFPAKPIRIVVGFPPGGSGDFLTRLIADEMAKDLGVAVVADNRPGAGGNIAAEIVAKAGPDGYTLVNSPHHAINIALYKNTNYQEKDFAAVCRVATGATVLVLTTTSRSTACPSSSTMRGRTRAGFSTRPRASALHRTLQRCSSRRSRA
jgi:tripartite-type tricarboxylate transporter receptor subunit TctC